MTKGESVDRVWLVSECVLRRFYVQEAVQQPKILCDSYPYVESIFSCDFKLTFSENATANKDMKQDVKDSENVI